MTKITNLTEYAKENSNEKVDDEFNGDIEEAEEEAKDKDNKSNGIFYQIVQRKSRRRIQRKQQRNRKISQRR